MLLSGHTVIGLCRHIFSWSLSNAQAGLSVYLLGCVLPYFLTSNPSSTLMLTCLAQLLHWAGKHGFDDDFEHISNSRDKDMEVLNEDWGNVLNSLERSGTFAVHFLICLKNASNVIVQPDWTGTQTVKIFSVRKHNLTKPGRKGHFVVMKTPQISYGKSWKTHQAYIGTPKEKYRQITFWRGISLHRISCFITLTTSIAQGKTGMVALDLIIDHR